MWQASPNLFAMCYFIFKMERCDTNPHRKNGELKRRRLKKGAVPSVFAGYRSAFLNRRVVADFERVVEFFQKIN